jgi:hypothetical protein
VAVGGISRDRRSILEGRAWRETGGAGAPMQSSRGRQATRSEAGSVGGPVLSSRGRRGGADERAGDTDERATGTRRRRRRRKCNTIRRCGARFWWKGRAGQVNAARYLHAIPIPNSSDVQTAGIREYQCQFRFRGSNVYFQTQPKRDVI